MLATMRPEETDRNHPATRLQARVGARRQINRNSPAAVERSGNVGARAGRLPTTKSPRTIADLYRTTKGNPLFVVECIQGWICGTPDAARRIHAVIGARLAQLSPRAYELRGGGNRRAVVFVRFAGKGKRLG